MTSINNWLAANAGLAVIIVAVLVLILAGLSIWLALRLRKLERHYAVLTAGSDGANLQALLESHVQEVRSAVCRVQELDAETHRLDEVARHHVQHVGLVRFNPFRETGGDQSFVVALADRDGNGAVLSSLHSRDVTRVYAKPLVAWSSPYPLTVEELEGIRRAKERERVAGRGAEIRD